MGSTFPTISLAMIMKNERHHLPRMLASVKDCFHEIHITDTGSTDGSVEWVLAEGEKVSGAKIFVHHFKWVNDFSKARNYSISHITTDYWAWMDLDDMLSDRESFILWRDHVMVFSDFHVATYNYALDGDNKPIISFVRERAFRTSLNAQFQYPIHEGVVFKPEWKPSYATTWTVDHHRTMEDITADKSRNLKILEEIQDQDGRLMFYYGKELYENQKPMEAMIAFEKALKREDLQLHDRVLSYQYAAYSAQAMAGLLREELIEQRREFFQKAINFASDGIKLDPHRAEFFVAIGDSYIQLKQLKEAIPYFAAAKFCINPRSNNMKYEGAIYSFVNCYGELPTLQLAKIYFHLGEMDKAKKEAQECVELYQNEEAQGVLKECERVISLITVNNNQEETEDILFSCPPQNVMEFDEEIYKTKPMGGSETALIQMARNLKELTGRPVKVFNQRSSDLVAESGVEYISNAKLNEYVSKYKPKVHIAWRHNIKVTNAKTYLWCHDLQTQSVESMHNFDKIMCLTPFHKNYVRGLQGVPEDKIWVTRNGIDPSKFAFEKKPKDPNKIVYASSADRGLDSCMLVMDEVVKEFPEAKLHIYYGYENLYKYGPQMSALADKIKTMISDRSYVIYHGFTEQNKMYQEIQDAVIWLHPCNWVETSCITAMEMLANQVFPITRSLGGLKDTLNEAREKNQAVLLDHEFNDDTHRFTPADIKRYYNEVCKALLNKSWERIDYSLEDHSWKTVAQEWIKEMGL